MKSLFLFLFSFFSVSLSFADCSSSGIYYWPSEEQQLSETPIIMIQGYAFSRDYVLKTQDKFPVYLKSNNHLVKMDVFDMQQSDFYLTQVLFKPSEKLIVGESYSLYIIDSEEKNPFKLDYELDKQNSKASWTVKKTSNSALPKFTSAVKSATSEIEYYGCGPSKYLKYDIKTNLTGSFLIKTELTDQQTNKTQTYYVQASNGSFSIGHGMCSGEFTLSVGTTYQLKCTLLNKNGVKGKVHESTVTYSPENAPY